jgi:hypothetical protein
MDSLACLPPNQRKASRTRSVPLQRRVADKTAPVAPSPGDPVRRDVSGSTVRVARRINQLRVRLKAVINPPTRPQRCQRKHGACGSARVLSRSALAVPRRSDAERRVCALRLWGSPGIGKPGRSPQPQ